MALKEFALKYGEEIMKFSLPEEQVINVMEGVPYPGIEDFSKAIKEALDKPIDSAPLKSIVRPGDKVCIVASDITRGWIRQDQILPIMLDILNEAGVPDSDIYIVTALGAHRNHVGNELEILLGKETIQRVKVYEHTPREKDNMKYLGKTSHGVEVYINKQVMDADKIILLGGVILHFMSGFGGGRKSCLPGIAYYDTIQANHCLCLHEEVGKGISPNCQSGKLKDNICHEDMMEIASLVHPHFIVNVVQNAEGQFAGVFAGNWATAWYKASQLVREMFCIPIKEQADIVIATCGGYPKDINLYQSSKTIYNAHKATKKGGVMIILSECRDIHEPPDFAQWFDYKSKYNIELALRETFTVPGYVALLTRTMAEDATTILVTLEQNKEFVKKAGLIPVTTIEEALGIAFSKMGDDAKVIIMPHGANTLPVLE